MSADWQVVAITLRCPALKGDCVSKSEKSYLVNCTGCFTKSIHYFFFFLNRECHPRHSHSPTEPSSLHHSLLNCANRGHLCHRRGDLLHVAQAQDGIPPGSTRPRPPPNNAGEPGAGGREPTNDRRGAKTPPAGEYHCEGTLCPRLEGADGC